MIRASWFGRLLLSAGLWVSACHGQEFWDTLSLKTGRAGGIHVNGISVYLGHSSFTGPNTLDQVVPANVKFGGDTSYGAQWSLGWVHSGARTSASVLYSGSYGGQARYTNLNAFGHYLVIEVDRHIGTRWSCSLSATGDYRTLNQYLFQPSPLSVVSQLPASPSDLGAAFSVGNFSSNGAAAVFSGTPSVGDGASLSRYLLLADRILTYQVRASASYSPTSRLSLTFSGVSAGGQHSFDDNAKIAVPRTIGVNAGLTLSYSLSPRTSIGMNVFENRTENQFQTAYSTTASGNLGRMMGQHWFLSINGGMTYNITGQQTFGAQTYTPPASKQVIGNGSLGYRVRAHTLLGSYSRSSLNTYGDAVGLYTLAAGAWQWARPGSAWRVYSSVSRYGIQNTGFSNLTGWRTNAGFSRILSRQFSANVEYAYMYSLGSYLNIPINRTIQSARVSIRWHPQGVPHAENPGVLGAPGMTQPGILQPGMMQ